MNLDEKTTNTIASEHLKAKKFYNELIEKKIGRKCPKFAKTAIKEADRLMNIYGLEVKKRQLQSTIDEIEYYQNKLNN